MPPNGRDLYEQGVAREQAGDIGGAFEAYRRSAKADPHVAAPYVGLARILVRNQQRAEALACLQRAAACEPNNPAVRVLLGRALSQDGKLEQARSQFEIALDLDEGASDAAIGLGAAHEDLGDRATAAEVYRRALRVDAGHAHALAGLLGVADGETLDAALKLGQERMASAPDRDASVIGYALGKALGKRGRHGEAFAAWANANAARRRAAGPFDRDSFDARVDRLIELYPRAVFEARRGWGDPSPRPTFIVGMPRSGTTLTEQILASHPQVYGAGELDVLTDMATGTPDRLGRPEPAWPDSAPELTADHVAAIARDHLGRLNALAPDAADRIIDKQPLNFWHLGLVALTFPNACVIHSTRDIRDCGLSIFSEDFAHEQRWATDLGDIAHYWRGQKRLMAHWATATDLNILEVAYEDLVRDLEGQARRMLGALGVAWDPAVLRFHEQERAIQTPSRWQVRKPLYASSSGRWRAYEAHISPLVAAHD